MSYHLITSMSVKTNYKYSILFAVAEIDIMSSGHSHELPLAMSFTQAIIVNTNVQSRCPVM